MVKLEPALPEPPRHPRVPLADTPDSLAPDISRGVEVHGAYQADLWVQELLTPVDKGVE